MKTARAFMVAGVTLALVAPRLASADATSAGLDPDWLFESPPPLPRRAVPPAMLEHWARVPQLMLKISGCIFMAGHR